MAAKYDVQVAAEECPRDFCEIHEHLYIVVELSLKNEKNFFHGYAARGHM